MRNIRKEIERFEDLRHDALDTDDNRAAEEFKKELAELREELDEVTKSPASQVFTAPEDPLDVLIAIKNEYEAMDGIWPPPELSLEEFFGVEGED